MRNPRPVAFHVQFEVPGPRESAQGRWREEQEPVVTGLGYVGKDATGRLVYRRRHELVTVLMPWWHADRFTVEFKQRGPVTVVSARGHASPLVVGFLGLYAGDPERRPDSPAERRPAVLPSGIELAGVSPDGRSLCLLTGKSLNDWSVGRGAPRFTLMLALNDDYSHDEITSLAARLAQAKIGYLAAWGRDCEWVHDAFDAEFVQAEMRGERRPYLMTSWHEDEPLAEAVWHAIYAAWSDVERDVPMVVFGTDRDDWCAEIRRWLGDLEALEAEVDWDDDETDA